MTSFFHHAISGFSLGLTTGPFCFAACFPVLLSLTLPKDTSDQPISTWSFVGKFIAGRFAGYLALGLSSAMVGAAVSGIGSTLYAYAWIILSCTLIAYGLGLPLPKAKLCERIWRRPAGKFFPYALGVLTAVNVCPPVLLATTYSLESGSPLAGLTVFGSFFVATSLFLIPAGFTGLMPQRALIAKIGRLFAVVVGLVFLWQSLSVLWWYSG